MGQLLGVLCQVLMLLQRSSLPRSIRTACNTYRDTANSLLDILPCLLPSRAVNA